MVSVPFGNITNFIQGGLQQLGKQQDMTDKLDLMRQEQWAKVQPQEEINRAREEDNENLAKAKSKLTDNSTDALTSQDKELMNIYQNPTGKVNVPQANVGASVLPGQQTTQAGSAGGVAQDSDSMANVSTNTASAEGTAPIQGQGQIQQQPLPPVTQQVQGSQPPAAAPQGQAPNQPQQGDTQVTMQNMSAGMPTTPPPAAPSSASANSPYSQIAQQAASNGVATSIAQGASPAEAWAMNNPQFGDGNKQEWSNFAHTYGITDERDLQYLISQKASFLANGQSVKDWQNSVVAPWLKQRADMQANTAPESSLTLSPQEKVARAAQYNVPVAEPTYWDKLTAKQQEQEYQNQSKAFDKQYQTVVPAAQDVLGKLNEAIGLIDKVGTGGANALPGSAQYQAAMDANKALMQKDFAYITLRNKPSSGFARVTNADLQMFQQSSADFGKPNEANKVILLGMKAARQDEVDFMNFKQSWLDSNHNVDNSQLNKAWDNYTAHNPIFDPSSTAANPVLNENRMSYQDFFTGKTMKDIGNDKSATTHAVQQAKSSDQAPAQAQQTTASPAGTDGKPSYSHLW